MVTVMIVGVAPVLWMYEDEGCALCRHFAHDKWDDDGKEDCNDYNDDDEKCDSDDDENMTMTMMIGVRCLAAPPSDPLSSPWSTDDTSFHHQDCSLLSSKKYTNTSSNKTTIIPNTNITTIIIKPTFQPLKHYHNIHQNQCTIIAFYQKSLWIEKSPRCIQCQLIGILDSLHKIPGKLCPDLKFRPKDSPQLSQISNSRHFVRLRAR